MAVKNQEVMSFGRRETKISPPVGMISGGCIMTWLLR